MTRELLLEYICPGYRAPACFKGDTSFNCSDCNHVLNEILDRYDKQIRADAIDEFVRKLYEGCNEMIETCGSNTAPISWAEAYADFKADIDVIAEQLKEQKK